VFEPIGGGLRLLDADPGWRLPAELVWGAKYRGKTHELVTQLALNVALAACSAEIGEGGPILLDPMAGRGTTLLWAARHGIDAWGVEQDASALQHFQRHVKRQTKLQRIKHREQKGSVGRKRRDGVGRFLEYRFTDVATARLVTGDSRDLPGLLGGKRFHLLVSDLPYGVQHTGRDRRSPVQVLEACAPGWAASLLPGGVVVLVFNRLQPRRADLEDLFTAQGLEVLPFEAPHRMSESIWRDLLVLHSPR
jgi:tRNA G10  N-methylase Trm11